MRTGSSIAPAASIGPGTIVGGRFSVERHIASSALGELLFARDQKTRKPVAVWALAPGFARDVDTFEQIRTEVRHAAKLKHRSLCGTYGIGSLGDQRFVACEWVHGTSLADLVARLARDPPLSVRGIYNVIAHICNALNHVHGEGTCHGALRPQVVWISRSGRVKLAELGVDLALARSGKWNLLSADEQACLAPEVVASGSASPVTDVYGVGVLLYHMLTRRLPNQPLVLPSEVHPEGSAELDAIVSRCLASDPSARFQTVSEVRAAVLRRVANSKEPPPLEFGVDLEIDVDVALSIPPPPSRPQRKGSRSAGNALKDGAADEKLAALMSKLTENDTPRWIGVKDGLDHGPFTARELIKLIVEGVILEQHDLSNMRTGERKRLGDWHEFREFVEQYKLRKVEADHALALERSKRVERRSNVAKFTILGSLIGVLLLGGGAYLVSRRAAQARRAEREVDLAALFESGKVKVRGTAGILTTHPPRGQRRAGNGASSATTNSPGGGFGSYEDAMNQAIDLGDANKSGGERQLRTADIEAVMNRQLNTLFGCVSQELRAKRRLGDVQIDLAIRGSGQVMGASVNTGSPGFKRCIAGRLRQLNFPSFPAPRMGARYSFSVE